MFSPAYTGPTPTGTQLLALLAATHAFATSTLAVAGPQAMTLDDVAHGYVELTLAIGEHDPNYVDAYYGPEETRAKVKAGRVACPRLSKGPLIPRGGRTFWG